jgi:hypothetical protein
MNKIIAIFDLPGYTQKNYDDIVAELIAQGAFLNENRSSHVAFQNGGNWCVIDVWNSEKALMEFGQNTLFPIFAKLGLTPQVPRIVPVHKFVGASVEELIPA